MNYFQQLAAKYDAWFKTPHGQYVYKYEREMIFHLLDIQKGVSVADIGCGTGIYTHELCLAGAKVTGVDISPEMLAIAAERNRAHGLMANFIEGDAQALPFTDNTFDCVISITAMEFFQEPAQCLQEMYRILKPGGHMVVATINSLNIWSLERRIKTWYTQSIFSRTRFYSINDMKSLLAPLVIDNWRGGIFVPPFAPERLINNPDRMERWAQAHIPAFGAFLVVRVNK